MGLAIMERSTGERLLAVADCGNDRVQIFDLAALIVKGLIPGLPSTLPADMIEEATTKAQQIVANAHVEAQRMAETARSQRT